jgi:hypothetical protein
MKINYNEVVLKTDKGGNRIDFSYDDYKNSLKQKSINNTNVNTNPLTPNVIGSKPIDNKDPNQGGFSYEEYLKQRNNTNMYSANNPYVSKQDIKNSNTEYIVDKMLRPENYLNFENMGVNDNKLENTQNVVESNDNNVYNPYSTVMLNDFKPVYKGTAIANNDFTTSMSFNNMPNNFSGGNINKSNTMSGSTPNPNVHNMVMPNFNEINSSQYKYNKDGGFPK